MKTSTILIYVLFILISCITQFDFSSSKFLESLVVEGMITDQPGPYLVKLSKTVPVTDQLSPINWIKGAKVVIQSDVNKTETLIEQTPGNYYTTSIQGIVGRTY